jgi:hypothetical protein
MVSAITLFYVFQAAAFCNKFDFLQGIKPGIIQNKQAL